MRIFDQSLSFLVAFSLAFLVWLYARSRGQETLDNVPVPVRISLPASQAADFSLGITGPSQVLVSFTGPPGRIRELRSMLQRGELEVNVTLLIPEERQQDSHFLDTVVIDSSEIHPPRGVTAVVMEGHNRIPVTVRRLVEKRLHVRFDASQEDRYTEVEADPPWVVVHGPQDVLERTESIATVPYSISSHLKDSPAGKSSRVGPVPIVQELEGKAIQASPSGVMLKVKTRAPKRTYDLRVPIRFLCPENFAFRPSFANENEDHVNLTVSGPSAEEPPQVCAFVDLTHGVYDRVYTTEPIRLQLPRDFQLAQPPPGSVEVKLLPAEPMMPDLGRTLP
jgi:hypothetical protein